MVFKTESKADRNMQCKTTRTVPNFNKLRHLVSVLLSKKRSSMMRLTPCSKVINYFKEAEDILDTHETVSLLLYLGASYVLSESATGIFWAT
jgi:hypothetical protein